MPKQITLKTSTNNLSVSAYIKSLTTDQEKDAKTLLKLFSESTGSKPQLWGRSIIGFGEYSYTRSNGDTGSFLATGFSMRTSGPTIYIMPGYTDYSDILAKLGPYKLGKSCLYLKNLEDIHIPTLKKLIKAGLKDLKKTHPVAL